MFVIGRRAEVRRASDAGAGGTPGRYAGRIGEITQVSQNGDTGAITGYVVRLEDSGAEIILEPEEVRVLDDWA